MTINGLSFHLGLVGEGTRETPPPPQLARETRLEHSDQT